MNWYYVKDGAQAGPVSEAELDQLARSGALAADTLVWHEGMANWTPYSTARSSAQAPAAGSGAPLSMSASASAPVDGKAPCAECGNSFPVEEMVRHGRSYVCAACKPVFMQRLAEGAKIQTSQLAYASFGVRFGAVFLDGLILAGVGIGINLIAGLGISGAGDNPGQFTPVMGVVLIIKLFLGVLYEGIMVGALGATLGKMACKIRVVNADGSKLSYAKAFGRYFAKMLSSLTCLIGFIIAAFDDQRRSLHDRICDTRVVAK